MSLEASIATSLASQAPESIVGSAEVVSTVWIDVILNAKFDDHTIAPWEQSWGTPREA